uniref:Integrase catalytic domain-containing protein n=1 Tax=Cannabis sativa TaxID=3483 RepID=A0A803QL95_CANSA
MFDGVTRSLRGVSHYCKEQDIMRYKLVRHTPQQNGVDERMNMTLLNKARCMLLSVGLSKGFQGEAVITDAYLINRCPSSAINLKTPDEVWSGKPPDLTNLRVFGCAVYAHQSIKKLEPRAIKGVFLGYPKGVRGYRIRLRDQGG